jgi:hypothetical protein
LDKKIVSILVATMVSVMLVSLSPAMAVSPPATCYAVPTYGGSFYNCQLTIYPGWNLVSLPVVPYTGANPFLPSTNVVCYSAVSCYSNAVNFIFHGNLAKGTVVESYVGVWLTCAVTTTVGSCVGSLVSLVDGKGYWVYNPGTLFTIGSSSTTTGGYLYGSVIPPGGSPPAYALTKGWNLVGFKSSSPAVTTSEVLSTYLTSISGSYDPSNVWVLTSPAGTWTSTSTSSILLGQAMWLLVTSSTTLYPE